MYIHAFFYKEPLYKEPTCGRPKYLKNLTTKGKIPKELFIFKFRALYSDASEDYITLDDINGIDMILLD